MWSPCTERLARSSKALFWPRGGPSGARCPGCRLRPQPLPVRPAAAGAHARGVCLLMADTEALKPSNTGWLVADVVADTFAFGWTRTEVPRPAGPAGRSAVAAVRGVPGDYAEPQRVVTQVAPPAPSGRRPIAKPLFVLLDATWAEARRMFRKSPHLDTLPVLSLQPEQSSRYRLRRPADRRRTCARWRWRRCAHLAGEEQAAQVMEAYLGLRLHPPLPAGQEPAAGGPRRCPAPAPARPVWCHSSAPAPAHHLGNLP